MVCLRVFFYLIKPVTTVISHPLQILFLSGTELRDRRCRLYEVPLLLNRFDNSLLIRVYTWPQNVFTCNECVVAGDCASIYISHFFLSVSVIFFRRSTFDKSFVLFGSQVLRIFMFPHKFSNLSPCIRVT